MEDITKTGPVGLEGLKGLNQMNDAEYENYLASFSAPSINGIRANRLPSMGLDYEVTTGEDLGSSMFDLDIYSLDEISRVGDVRAENQGPILKLGAGVGKMVTTAAATIIDGTLGTLNGLGLGLTNLFDNDPNTTFTSGLWNNSVVNAMSAFQESMEEYMPNYRTQWEQNAPWHDLLLTANFWGDSVLKNAGFTMGTVATALLTGGVGNALKGVGILSKAARGLKLMDAAGDATKFGKMANWTLTNFLAANGESVIEAANSVKASKESLDYEINALRDSEQKNLDSWYYQALDDPRIDRQQLQVEYERKKAGIDSEIEKIYKERAKVLTQAGNTVWELNMATLVPTNNINLSSIVRGGYHTGKNALDNARRTISGEATSDASKFARGILEGISGFAINEVEHGAAKVAGRTLLNAAAEGTQEGLLRLISSSSEILSESKLNKFTRENTLLGAELNDEAKDEYVDYFRAMNKAYEDSFGSIDSPGWEEVAVGALMGAFGVPMIKAKSRTIDKLTGKIRTKYGLGMVGGIAEAKQDVYGNLDIDKQKIDIVNEFLQNEETRNNIKNAVASISIENKKQKALRDSDINTYKNAEIMALTKDAIRAKRLGVLDEYLSTFKELASNMTDEDIEEFKATTTQLANGKSFLEGMTSDQIKETYQGKANRTLEKIKNILDRYDYNISNYANKFDLDVVDYAVSELTLRDALSLDLARRIDLINKEIDELDSNSPTYQQDWDEKQKTVSFLYKLKQLNDELLRNARSNPEEFSNVLRNIIKEQADIEIGKNAEKVLQQYENAKSLKDINNIYHHSDLSFRGSVFELARKKAPKEVQSLMDLYHNFINMVDSVEGFVDDYFKDIPEEFRQNNIDFFKELFRVIFEELFEDENPNLSKDAIIEELDKGIKYFEDAINLNSGLNTQQSFIDLLNARASKAIFTSLKDHLNQLLDTMDAGNHEEKEEISKPLPKQVEEELPLEEGDLGFGETSLEELPEETPKTVGDTFENFIPQSSTVADTRELLKKEFDKNYNLLKVNTGNNEKAAVENAKALISLLKDKKFKIKEKGAKVIKSLLDSLTTNEKKAVSEWYNKKYNKAVTPKTKTKVTSLPVQAAESPQEAQDNGNYLFGNQADLYIINDGVATIREEIPDEVKNVKYQYFIDNFLPLVIENNPEIPIHYARKKGAENWIFLSINLNDIDEDNRDWINRNSKSLTIENGYVIMGVLGFNPNQAVNKKGFYNVKNHLDEEFKGQTADWLFSESTNNIKSIQGGQVVTLLPNQTEKTLKPVGLLLNNIVTNPYGLSESNIKMIYVSDDKGKTEGINTEGMVTSKVDFAKYNKGTVLMFIPDATGKWVPTTIVPNYLFSLPEDAYLRQKAANLISLLFDVKNTDPLSTYMQLHDIVNLQGMYYNGKNSKNPNTIGIYVNKLDFISFDLNDKDSLEEQKEKFINLLLQLNPKVNLTSGDLRNASSILHDGTILTNLAVLGTMGAKFTVFGVNPDMTLEKKKDLTYIDRMESNSNQTSHFTNFKVNNQDYFYRKTKEGIEFFDAARNKIEDTSLNQELKDIMNIKLDIGVKKVIISPKKGTNKKESIYWEVGDRIYYEGRPDVFTSVEGELIKLYREKQKNANIVRENTNTASTSEGTEKLWDENPTEEKKALVHNTVAYVNTIGGKELVFYGKYVRFDKSKNTAVIKSMTDKGEQIFKVPMSSIAPNYLKGETVLYVNKAVNKDEHSGEIIAIFAKDGIPYARIKNPSTNKSFEIPMKDIKRLDEEKKYGTSIKKEKKSTAKKEELSATTSPKYTKFLKGKTVVLTLNNERVIAEIIDTIEVAPTGNIKYKYRNKITDKEGFVWHSTILNLHEILEPGTKVTMFKNAVSQEVTIVNYIPAKTEGNLGHYTVIDFLGNKEEVWESQVVTTDVDVDVLLLGQEEELNDDLNGTELSSTHQDTQSFDVFNAKDRVKASKLLNKENIIDARISVDGGLEVFVKLEGNFPHLAGVISFNSKRNKWEVHISRLSKYNPSELTEEEKKKFIEGDLSFVTQETAEKVVNHYIPKDLQEYYMSGQNEKDNKEKLKYQDSLEEKGLSSDERIEALNRTSIGEEGVVRDKWGIYFINEWTNKTNYFVDNAALQDPIDNTQLTLGKVSGGAGDIAITNLKTQKDLANLEKSNKFAEYYNSFDDDVSKTMDSICTALGLSIDDSTILQVELKIAERGFSINTVLDLLSLKELEDNLINCKK